jgi:hypothetical protein
MISRLLALWGDMLHGHFLRFYSSISIALSENAVVPQCRHAGMTTLGH